MTCSLTENQKLFIKWIKGREDIRIMKESDLPKPWSLDKIMQETYFTNIDREDDRVTKWIRENWLYHDGRAGLYEFSMFVARVFNKIETLEAIGQPYLENGSLAGWLMEVGSLLEYKRDKGEKLWSGAYIISTNGRKIDKLQHCIELFQMHDPLICSNFSRLQKQVSLADGHEMLCQVYGLASFLAAQIIADLKNTTGHPFSLAPDRDTFSAHGPGSLKGLSYFFEEKVTPKNYQEKINQARKMVLPYLSGAIMRKLCMQNFQNCFCEYSKYMRILEGTGKSKRKYEGS